MAYVKIINSSRGDLPFIYNVRTAVGPNSPNQRVEVLLVQYLLKSIFSNAGVTKVGPPPSGRPLVVDGVFGPITAEAILHFQHRMKALGMPIPTDGRVDRAFPSINTPHGKQWTIMFMNMAYREARQKDHDNLPGVGDCPSEVRVALL